MSSVILGLVLGSRIQRYSFDFTSLANPVFEYCSESGAGVYFLGSSQSDLSEFLDVIKVRHPTLNIVGAANGYFDDEASDSRASDIIQSGAEVVILGMGAPKQDDFSISLRNAGFKGTSFTCGGFMHQTASSHGDYYPKIINRLNLRFIYRMLKEPNTIKRYCVDYPICLVYLIFGRLTGRLRMNIIDGAGQCQMR
jgi:N-acetylglucosaminyldiphosphoundecaprenol N-acetyl-beta-D-mannosaminyltransferase